MKVVAFLKFYLIQYAFMGNDYVIEVEYLMMIWCFIHLFFSLYLVSY